MASNILTVLLLGLLLVRFFAGQLLFGLAVKTAHELPRLAPKGISSIKLGGQMNPESRSRWYQLPVAAEVSQLAKLGLLQQSHLLGSQIELDYLVFHLLGNQLDLYLGSETKKLCSHPPSDPAARAHMLSRSYRKLTVRLQSACLPSSRHSFTPLSS